MSHVDFDKMQKLHVSCLFPPLSHVEFIRKAHFTCHYIIYSMSHVTKGHFTCGIKRKSRCMIMFGPVHYDFLRSTLLSWESRKVQIRDQK